MIAQRFEIHIKDMFKQNSDFQPFLQTYIQEYSDELPAGKRRPAVIICPGGGYSYRSDREAEPVALQFLSQGMHAFVLQYSVSPARFPCALLELAHAVKLIREHAQEWHVDGEKIFICGFSAGGHLCASLGTMWNEELLHMEFKDMDSSLWRPAGMILSYPVITSGIFAHEGSIHELLGEGEHGKLREIVSLEKRVNKDTVPAFIWHTGEDGAVPVENALLLAAALRKEHIPFELHIYERGGHGLALCNELTATAPEQIQKASEGWIDLALKWMRQM